MKFVNHEKIIEIGESELIGRYSKFSIEYFRLKTGYFWKFGTTYWSLEGSYFEKIAIFVQVW